MRSPETEAYKAENIAASLAVKEEARMLAVSNRLHLIHRTDIHWTLISERGWTIELYPSNQRIFRGMDSNRKRAPYLRIDKDPWETWTVLDVVKAAIEADHV